RAFLKNRIPELEAKVEGGKFVDTQGHELGRHRGYPFYTIGQRKGLDVALGRPVFVTKIDPATNTVTLGDEEDLHRQQAFVSRLNWVKYPGPVEGMRVTTQVRYRDAGGL